MKQSVLLWVPRLVAGAIMCAVGYLKLTQNEVDVALFTELGMEPHGRVIIGIIEIAAGLLLMSPQAAAGAMLAISVMCGALIAHVTVLGFEVAHTIMLLAVLISALIVAYYKRADIPFIGNTLATRDSGRTS